MWEPTKPAPPMRTIRALSRSMSLLLRFPTQSDTIQNVFQTATRTHHGGPRLRRRQLYTTLADPSRSATRVAHDERMIRHAARHHRTSADKRISADPVAAHNRAIRAQCGAPPYMGCAVFV